MEWNFLPEGQFSSNTQGEYSVPPDRKINLSLKSVFECSLTHQAFCLNTLKFGMICW